MGEAARITEESWSKLNLLPASIPHLFHWDFAYLWVLEREKAHRPGTWGARVEGWRRLLGLLFTNQLTVGRQEIPAPMRAFCERYGIQYLDELKLNGKVVGVLSPICFLRPLPDATDEELMQLPDALVARKSEVYKALEWTIESITKDVGGHDDRPLQISILGVLEVMAKDMGGPGSGTKAHQSEPALDFREIALARSMRYEKAQFDTLHYYISTGEETQEVVPRCTNAGCAKSLLKNADAAPVDVAETDDTVEVLCPSSHLNRIALSSLMLWNRNAHEVVAWTDRGTKIKTESGKLEQQPPAPELVGNQVMFTWQTSGDVANVNARFLKIRFPDKHIVAASFFEDARFKKLLMPGMKEMDFNAHPIRMEWCDATDTADVRPTLYADVVEYRGIAVKGLPFPVRLTYAPTSTERAPRMAVGVYPQPMHPEWKQYRAFVLPPDASGNFSIRVAGANAHGQATVDCESWPQRIEVRGQSLESGCDWNTSPDTPTRPQRDQDNGQRVSIGIDFGTSNTVVYFKHRGADSSIKSAHNAVAPQDLQQLVHWIIPASTASQEQNWFLPGPVPSGQDRFLFPSAMWIDRASGQHLIRWNTQAPPGAWERSSGFKWDIGMENRTLTREAYLKELLRWTIPAIYQKLGNRQALPGVDLGFAFPLAFTHQRQMQYRELLDGLARGVGQSCGASVETFHMNESLASVRAIGKPDYQDLYLVADMGGRTMDVALFSYEGNGGNQEGPSLHQIGSIDFGGEAFLEACISNGTSGVSDDESRDNYWRLRDEISGCRSGKSAVSSPRVAKLLDRFLPMALEYLRVMLTAFRESHRTGPLADKPIRLVLAGNGWRLRELTAGDRDPAVAFKVYFNDMAKAFQIPEIDMTTSFLQGVDKPKHWVAIGALHAIEDGTRELNGETKSSKLPAGLDLNVGGRRVEWHELCGFGNDCVRFEMSNDDVRNGPIQIDAIRRPRPSEVWGSHLSRALGGNAELPSAESARQEIALNIKDSYLTKSPLDFVVESHWKAMLEKP